MSKNKGKTKDILATPLQSIEATVAVLFLKKDYRKVIDILEKEIALQESAGIKQIELRLLCSKSYEGLVSAKHGNDIVGAKALALKAHKHYLKIASYIEQTLSETTNLELCVNLAQMLSNPFAPDLLRGSVQPYLSLEKPLFTLSPLALLGEELKLLKQVAGASRLKTAVNLLQKAISLDPQNPQYSILLKKYETGFIEEQTIEATTKEALIKKYTSLQSRFPNDLNHQAYCKKLLILISEEFQAPFKSVGDILYVDKDQIKVDIDNIIATSSSVKSGDTELREKYKEYKQLSKKNEALYFDEVLGRVEYFMALNAIKAKDPMLENALKCLGMAMKHFNSAKAVNLIVKPNDPDEDFETLASQALQQILKLKAALGDNTPISPASYQPKAWVGDLSCADTAASLSPVENQEAGEDKGDAVSASDPDDSSAAAGSPYVPHAEMGGVVLTQPEDMS